MREKGGVGGKGGVWSLDDARHLLQRTGFAEPPARVMAAVAEGRSSTVAAILNSHAPISPLPPPAWVNSPFEKFSDFKGLKPAPKREAVRTLAMVQRNRIVELRGWWLGSLALTENTLGARMTLFWQNHFTSSIRTVRYAELMYRQQCTLSRHALGRLDDLLEDVLRDPAMLIYLDNRTNRKSHPNENLARELLELFTLGEGNYSESDVRELARALTGLGVDQALDFRFNARRHDAGEKSILGESGTFALPDVVALLLGQPGTAEHIVSKLWHTMVSPEVAPAGVRRLAAVYRDSGYDMHRLLEAVLMSDEFWSEAARGVVVKSPVEFIIGSVRILSVMPTEPLILVRATDAMQQTLYAPPTVRGWVGGDAWVSAQTLLARRRFVRDLLRDDSVDIAASSGKLSYDMLSQTILPASLIGSVAGPGKPLERILRSVAYNLC